MRLLTLYRRSLVYHWRSHLASTLGVAAAAAVLTGALVVGDSIRGSLHELAVGRLGRVDYALVAQRFFREALASEIAESPEFSACCTQACPIISLRGSLHHTEHGSRVNRINILGVDHRFWVLDGTSVANVESPASGRSIVLNQPLARELGVEPGDDVLVRLEKKSEVPTETLLGRREGTILSLRLTVHKIIDAKGLGGFSLNPTQYHPFNAYIPLATLQRALKQPDHVNIILAAGRTDSKVTTREQPSLLQHLIDQKIRLADVGLKLRRDEQLGYIALESNSMLIKPVIETAAIEAAEAMGLNTNRVLTYLANTIKVEQPVPSSAVAPTQHQEIPYSTVTAIEVSSGITLLDGKPALLLATDEILLNQWAAKDLAVKPGDCIRLTYYSLGPFGQLDTDNHKFHLRGIVKMEGLAADRGLTPEYKGVTDSPDLADWDPPFPIDLSRIRKKDEAYWDNHGPTPKAFVSLKTGQAIWGQNHERFGRLTSIRLKPTKDVTLETAENEFARQLLQRLRIDRMGLTIEPVKTRALNAAQGGTDFGMLFLGFSFFLIFSAALLVTLLFRLGIERRSFEIGILVAEGFLTRTISRLLLAEGALLAVMGSVMGLLGAMGYAWLMLAGLRSWWSAAANAPFLRIHISVTSLSIGFLVSVLIGLLSIFWAVRGLSRASPRALLTGTVPLMTHLGNIRRRRFFFYLALVSLISALVLIGLSIGTGLLSDTTAFFGSGTALLVGCLAGLAFWIRRQPQGVIVGNGMMTIARLGLRNAGRYPRRSLLTTGLIASATFILVTVGANRHQADRTTDNKYAGTGGFSLVAESAIPILHDLNTAAGREAVNLSPSSIDVIKQAWFLPFRFRDGDEASCLNLYQAQSPRILGATEKMIRRGGFKFKSTLARTDEEKSNPWMLLNKQFADGVIPAIGDYNTVMWLLHLGLEQDLTVTDEQGDIKQLRIVAMLSGSILQGELIIAESQFVKLFPSISGYRFFLIDTPSASVHSLYKALEHGLADYGFDVSFSSSRLERFLAVENTYLSAFQTLGALGIILGTFGLAVVLLRNALERRGELALLRALGYRSWAVGWMVMAENTALLLWGMAAGGLSAGLAISPHALTSPSAIPWTSLGLTLVIVLLTGTFVGIVVLIPTLRSPLIPALRAE
ncbi:MAG: ABC transporter permease [Planctomycetota bacterium]|nr:MAG: ABC transporter permease [Planctomycetota bacterium]